MLRSGRVLEFSMFAISSTIATWLLSVASFGGRIDRGRLHDPPHG